MGHCGAQPPIPGPMRSVVVATTEAMVVASIMGIMVGVAMRVTEGMGEGTAEMGEGDTNWHECDGRHVTDAPGSRVARY